MPKTKSKYRLVAQLSEDGKIVVDSTCDEIVIKLDEFGKTRKPILKIFQDNGDIVIDFNENIPKNVIGIKAFLKEVVLKID